jgi:hypothetical protein
MIPRATHALPYLHDTPGILCAKVRCLACSFGFNSGDMFAVYESTGVSFQKGSLVMVKDMERKFHCSSWKV